MRIRSAGIWPLWLGLWCGLSSCATLQAGTSAPRGGQELPPGLFVPLPNGAALRLTGSVEGPLGGLGPSLEFDAWLVGAQLRADLHYVEEGRPRHEVLLWTPVSVLLFDRDRGGLTELGEEGRLTAWGARFSLAALHWLCLGRWPAEVPPPEFHRDGRDWEASDGELSLFGRGVDRSGHLRRTSIRWDDDGETRELTAELEVQIPVLGGRMPRRVRLDGDPLDLEVQLMLTVQVIENVDASVFDPLADP
ncbi:MAG TPA: hypothetical protein VGB13_03085 [Candidatus Krumholzibacteria bacterium]